MLRDERNEFPRHRLMRPAWSPQTRRTHHGWAAWLWKFSDEWDNMVQKNIAISRVQGIMTIDGTRYFEEMQQVPDGWHFAKTERNLDKMRDMIEERATLYTLPILKGRSPDHYRCQLTTSQLSGCRSTPLKLWHRHCKVGCPRPQRQTSAQPMPPQQNKAFAHLHQVWHQWCRGAHSLCE